MKASPVAPGSAISITSPDISKEREDEINEEWEIKEAMETTEEMEIKERIRKFALFHQAKRLKTTGV